MKFTKIIETSIYSSNLKQMKDFYIDILGLDLVSEEKDRHVFLKAEKSMFLIFNANNTLNNINDIFPSLGDLILKVEKKNCKTIETNQINSNQNCTQKIFLK